jgi:secondary thiamine-phosphate synthase enzyme
MRIHSDYLTVQTQQKREFMNITPNVKEAAEKSGIRDGLILICSLHANSGVFVNDENAGLLQDIETWLNQLAPIRDGYHHEPRGESNAGAHLQSLLLNHQVLVSLAEGRLELGPWQQVIFAELDGTRPKRILIKVIGE